jgi:hypothetical protein
VLRNGRTTKAGRFRLSANAVVGRVFRLSWLLHPARAAVRPLAFCERGESLPQAPSKDPSAHRHNKSANAWLRGTGLLRLRRKDG